MDEAPRAPTLDEFLWRLVYKAIFQSFGIADLVSGVLGAFAAYLLGDSPAVMKDLAWQIPLYTLAAVGLVRLAVAPYLMWREERGNVVALSQQFQPKLALVSDPACVGCVPAVPDRYTSNSFRAARRIGVQNISGVTISGVFVRIESMSPSPPEAALPMYLRPTNQRRTSSLRGGIHTPGVPDLEPMIVNPSGASHDHATFVVAAGIDNNAPEGTALDIAGSAMYVRLDPTVLYVGSLRIEGVDANPVYADFMLHGTSLELRPGESAE